MHERGVLGAGKAAGTHCCLNSDRVRPSRTSMSHRNSVGDSPGSSGVSRGSPQSVSDPSTLKAGIGHG